jgi:palmitoyl transferase
LFFVITFAFFTYPALAESQADRGILARAQTSLSQTWQAQDYELYVPINTWHNRNYYSSEKVDSFNEQPWGLGVGKYRFDDDGDWNGFYAMAFQDSHRHLEPVVGYGFQKMWRPTENLRLGAGYTIGFTMREDLHYIPVPGILPLASVEYKQLSLQSTYVPGGDGHGNILFTWLRWQLK